jgi:hypothetical protein
VQQIPKLAPLRRLLKSIYPTDGAHGPYTILSNGSKLVVARGLMQGCPMSPALFALALEGPLRRAAVASGVSAMAFVDDVIAIGKPGEISSFALRLPAELAAVELSLATNKCALYHPRDSATSNQSA